MHTLLTSLDNHVISFGHGKNGKLGDDGEEDSCFPTKALFPEKNVKIAECIAGYNISIALDYDNNKIYTWGYSGRGLLGRVIAHDDKRPGKMDLDLMPVAYQKFVKDGESNSLLEYPTEITKVAIGAVNTLILTNTGAIFVYGSDDYGQSGQNKDQKQERKKEFNVRKNNLIRILEQLSTPFQISMPISKKIIIADVAMGSHHIIALSKFSEIFSWGRNDEGQLGQGFMTRSIEIPTVVESMLKERIKSVYASENYSACLSHFGELFTCGSGEFGKLGNDVSKDVQSEFELVETNCPIKKVGMGIHHMVVIADYDEKDPEFAKDGRILVWGRNHKGQLGIGSREQCSRPEVLTKLHALNIRLIDVQCGLTFTVGLTEDLKLVYFGDHNYCPSGEIKEDMIEPVEVDEPKQKNIDSISVCYNKITVKTTKSEVFQYGEFLSATVEKSNQKTSSGGKVQFKSEAVMNFI
jgi:alpha-tubulin suppressor-like RCC1 family protein